ncbi:hypothetical protein B0H10DRAFT_2005340 [Mycena sp. CBHHK59/15]|nr:hypothetical protein B0H10DRAFT_2005340 [Mycena sp. CBHHK59/15]
MPASETSPLLDRESSQTFPDISGVLSRLGDRVDRVSVEEFCPRGVGDVCKETAFRLIVLLQSRARLRQQPSSDIWNHWAQTKANAAELDRLSEQVNNVWVSFLDEYRTTGEIEQVLWTPFNVSQGGRTVRVVDLLDADCPSELIAHDLIILSLANLWKHGPSPDETVLRPACTPRVLHAIDLATHLAYFGLLVSYVMHPPSRPIIFRAILEYVGPREILLMVFSSSIFVRSWTLFNAPFVITLLMFLSCLPSVPFPENASFNVLLLCLALHILQFHLPRAPSPLFLFKPYHTLPFAVFLAKGFSRLIFPIAPISSRCSFWTFFTTPTLTIFTLLAPTPMQTRTTVLFGFSGLIVAIGCSLFIFAVYGRGLDTPVSQWDTYSSTVGRKARVAFVRTVVSYATPYTFPAPFSLLQAVLISWPSFVFTRLGFRLPFAQAEKVLWRMFVGPVGLLFAVIMLLMP